MEAKLDDIRASFDHLHYKLLICLYNELSTKEGNKNHKVSEAMVFTKSQL
jgi:hypothetical protein